MTQEPDQPTGAPGGDENASRWDPLQGRPTGPGEQLPRQEPPWGQWGAPSAAPQNGWPQQPGWPQPAYPGYQSYTPPPKPGVIPLRPLTLGEVLDGAFQAARRNAKAMFGSALLVQAFSTLVNLGLLLLIFGSNFPLAAAAGGNVSSSELGSFLVTAAAASLVAAVLQSVTTLVLQGALVVPVSRAVLNRSTGFSQMWSLARGRIGALLALALLYLAAVLLGMAALVLIAWGLISALGPGGIALTVVLAMGTAVAATWMGAKVLVAPAVLVVENLGVFAAIARSWNLTTHHWWRTFGTAFLAQLIVGTITGVIAVPVGFVANMISVLVTPHPTAAQALTQALWVQAVSMVVSGLLGAVALAFESGVLALIYVDLRMRKEGFDVVLMKEHETGSNPDGIPGRGPGAVPWSPAAP